MSSVRRLHNARLGVLAGCVLTLAGLFSSRQRIPSIEPASVRLSEARLSDRQPWSACVPRESETGVGAIRCGSPTASGEIVHDLLTRAIEDARLTGRPTDERSDVSPGMLELQWAVVDEAAEERAIAHFERRRELGEDSSGVLNALTIGYLAKAVRTQSLRALLNALETSGRARRLNPRSAALAFNMALVLERLFMLQTAESVFLEAAALDTSASWQREARGRAARLHAATAPAWLSLREDSLVAAGQGGSRELIKAFARMSPVWRRDIAFRTLGEWGRGVLANDTEAARAARDIINRLVDGEREVGGDSSIAILARGLDERSPDVPRQNALAQAHVMLADGIAAYRRSDVAVALPHFSLAMRQFRAVGSPAEHWARLHFGYCLANLGRYDAAVREYALLQSDDRALAMPGLSGRTAVALGTALIRTSRIEDAERIYRAARAHLTRARDMEALGHVAFLLSEVLLSQGRLPESEAESLTALRLLAPLRRSSYLQSELIHLADLARRGGLPFAATASMNEAVALALSHETIPGDRASVYADRARDHLATGDMTKAAADLDSAEASLQQLRDDPSNLRLHAYVLLSKGEVLRSTAPEESLRTLLRAVRSFSAFRGEIYYPEALYQASVSARVLGLKTQEDQLLSEAIDALSDQSDGFRSSTNRAIFGETIEHVFDAAITLRLVRRDPQSAFALLERGRSATWNPERREGHFERATTLVTLTRSVPRGVSLIEYAVLPDRVAIWSISQSGWNYSSVAITRDSLRRLVDAVELELDSLSDPVPGSARARLFDMLLRGALDSLEDGRQIAVIPDRVLFRVPFPALWDSRRHANAIERIEFRTAPSASFAERALRRPSRISRDARVVSVGNNARAIALARHLPPLAHSESEAASVRQVFRSGRMLLGEGATPKALFAELPAADVLHFAGHAVFYEDMPELSYLLLSDGHEGGAKELTASEIARLRPSHLRVVFLSACRTLNPRDSRMGPVSGLAFSFINAGVPGIVSALWDVDDKASVPIVTTFYSKLLAGMSPAAALRSAQLAAIRSVDPRVRQARAWAVFSFSGA